MNDLRDHSQPCRHEGTDRHEGAYEWAGNWHCGDPSCPGGHQVTDAELVRMAAEAQKADSTLAAVWADVFIERTGDTG